MGEGPGKSREGGCKRHPALRPPSSAAGAATVTREGSGTSWERPSQAPQPGAQRLITRGLHGHIKQMTITMGLLLLEEETAAPSETVTDPGPRKVTGQGAASSAY